MEFIKSRKKSIKDMIEIYKSRNLIDEALIEEEYKSINMLKSNSNIINVNTNICKMDLPKHYIE